MSERLLRVPMLVDGLALDREEGVVAGARFDRLPWTGPDGDQNVGHPFLAETTHAPPFAAPDAVLGPGVHLHWTLPRALRTATHPRDAAGGEDRDRLSFPAVPDQWLVVRQRPGAREAAWRVDGAYVWGEDGGEQVASCWPWRIDEDGAGALRFAPPTDGDPRPWRWVGRSWRVGEGPPPAPAARLAPLRASGWGDPAYSSYYPACRGVFGFWDAEGDGADTYAVFGWYGDPRHDVLATLPLDGPAAAAELARRFGWACVDGPVPRRLLLAGVVGRDGIVTAGRGGPIGGRVALAETGTEALTTLLAHALAEEPAGRRRVERRLDALMLARELHGHEVDVGARLDDLRARRAFRASSGGVSRVLRERGAPATERAEPIALPASLADALDALDAAEVEARRTAAVVEALRERAYADWYRAIKATDPPDAFDPAWVLAEHDPSGGHDADSLYRHLREHTLAALHAAEAEASDAARARDARLAGVNAALDAHHAQPGAAPWGLDTIPGPVFSAPNDPVLALVGDDVRARDRWGGEGLPVDDAGRLLVRVEEGVDSDALADGTFRAALDLPPRPVHADPLHLYAMDWRVQLRPIAPGGPQYPADWLEAPRTEAGPTEILSGRSFLTQDAGAVGADALFGWLRERLETPEVGVLGEGWAAEAVHPLEAALAPPPGMRRVSWAANLGEESITEALLEAHAEAIEAWAGERAAVATLLAAAEGLGAWPSVPGDPPRILGLRADGPVAAALTAALADGPEELVAFGLPRPVAEALAGLDAPGLGRIVVTAGPYATAALAGLLRVAEVRRTFPGGVGGGPGVRELAVVDGVPEGGVLAATVLDAARTLDEGTLLGELGLREEVVAALLAAREAGGPETLAALASLPGATAATVGRLVAWVEDAWCADGTGFEPIAETAPDRGEVREDPIGTALRAWRVLRAQPDPWTLQLDGLHAALLQWDPAPQLPVADPVGFDDYRRFAEEVVLPAVGAATRRAPRPDAGFHPLRAGELRLDALRLVDTFGRVHEVRPDPTLVPADRVAATPGFHLALPPRVTQPARVIARWCAAGDGAELTGAHPARSPLCGWVVPDPAGIGLAVFRADGDRLGEIDAEGRWRTTPGRAAPSAPGEIADRTLRSVVLHLLEGAAADPDPATYVARLLDVLDAALDRIHPASGDDDAALALLVGRPLAVVRARVGVALAGPPASRQDTGAAVAALTNPEPDTLGFERVRVPLRVGAHHRLHDGVVGWWRTDADGAVDGPLRLPLAATHDLSVPLGDAPVSLVALLDPQGALHVECDLMPGARLELDGAATAEALRRMEVFVYSGPHLGPRGEVRLPLPREPGWRTGFLSPDDGAWTELDERPQVARPALEAAFPDVPDLWTRLLHDGVLVSLPERADRARVAPPPAQGPDGRLAGYPRADALARHLVAAARTLGPPVADLAPAPLELREGWLHLRRT